MNTARLAEVIGHIEQLADDDSAGDALREIASELRELVGIAPITPEPATEEYLSRVKPILSARLTHICPHGKRSNKCCGNPEWLRVIHAINRLHRAEHPDAGQYIGAPLTSYDWWAGGWCEEYPEFRVVLQDRSAYVQAKTVTAVDYLRRAHLDVTGRELPHGR